jgi:hypothetical protein
MRSLYLPCGQLRLGGQWDLNSCQTEVKRNALPLGNSVNDTKQLKFLLVVDNIMI